MSLILIQIVAVTGLLDEDRATYFVMPPGIASQFDEEQIQQVETVFVPLLMGGVFTMLVTNIVVVTFLTGTDREGSLISKGLMSCVQTLRMMA